MALDLNVTAPSTPTQSAYVGGEAVTKSDTVQLTKVARALYVGGAGNVAVVTAEGDTITIVGVTAGTLLPLMITQVMSTNTTATNMTALW
jgi:hypothetical protein